MILKLWRRWMCVHLSWTTNPLLVSLPTSYWGSAFWPHENACGRPTAQQTPTVTHPKQGCESIKCRRPVHDVYLSTVCKWLRAYTNVCFQSLCWLPRTFIREILLIHSQYMFKSETFFRKHTHKNKNPDGYPISVSTTFDCWKSLRQVPLLGMAPIVAFLLFSQLRWRPSFVNAILILLWASKHPGYSTFSSYFLISH